MEFEEFEEYPDWKILKISQTLHFQKSQNFWNCSISKNNPFSKF